MTSGAMTPHAAQDAARIGAEAANRRAAQKPAAMKTRPSPMPMLRVKASDTTAGWPSTPRLPPTKSDPMEVGGMMPR